MSFCLFCSKKSQPLTSVSEITLKKCKSVLLIRKKNNLALNDVLLPETLRENHMFHRICYQRFCALPPKHRPPASTSDAHLIESSESNVEASTSSRSSSCHSFVTEKKLADETEVTQSEGKRNDDELISSDFPEIEIVDNISNEPHDCVCVICTQARKRLKGRNQPLSICQAETIRNLKSYAIDQENTDLLDRLISCEAQNTAVYYHPHCKRYLQNKFITKNIEQREKTEWYEKRIKVHSILWQNTLKKTL